MVREGAEIRETERRAEVGRRRMARRDREEWRAPEVIAAGAVLLLGMALRAYRIDGQSLWYDEGVSAAMAPRDLGEITLRAAADIHPPLYYYLLHFWSTFAGTSELALRWLSLAWGVLLVAVAYALGRRLGNSQVGLFGGLSAAVSPFLVYYAQEARMYAQVAFLAGLSFLLFTRLIEEMTGQERAASRRRQVALVAGYVLASGAMLYSHYFAFTILVAQNVLAVGAIGVARWRGQGRAHGCAALRRASLGNATPGVRHLAYWVAVQAVITGTYLPWLLLSFSQLHGWPSISQAFDLGTLLRKVFLVFTFGLAWDAAATPNREAVFYALLVGLCFLPLAQYRRKYFGATLLLLYLATPVLILYALSLRRPMYNPKFLLLAAPAYALLLAVGLESVRQAGGRVLGALGKALPRPVMAAWSVGIVALFLVGVAYPARDALEAYYLDARYARDDYRGLVEFVSVRIRPGDAIIVNAPGQEEILRYYYKGSAPVYPLPQQRPPDEAKTAAALKEIVEKHGRVWLVLWATAESDPRSFVEHWLDENSFKTENRWFGSPRLCLYVNPGGAESSAEAAAVRFENGLRLRALRLGARVLEPGDSLSLTLTWGADRKIGERYKVFVHIIDEQELLWGQTDSEPAGGSKPTAGWAEDTEVEDRRGIAVLPGTPPGQYRLELGLYQAESGKRLGIVGEDGKPAGDRYLFGPIEVVAPQSPPQPGSLGIPRAGSAAFGNGIKLLGFKLQPLGRDGEGATFTADDTAHLTLFWQSGPPPAGDAAVQIELRDQSGRTVLSKKQIISEGLYPTSRWRAGELVRDQYKLPLAGLAAGEYTLHLAQIDQSGKVVAAQSNDATVVDGVLQIGRIRVR